jgi:DNA-binding transcriptional LysR family regulator
LPALDLELLRTFAAVADAGTFTAAGIRLGLSQAAVSQQMQRLASLAGKALFLKEGRGKQLTEHGRHLLRSSREMLALNDDAMTFMRDGNPSGSLRIGSPHDIAETILPQLLGHISRLMPNINLQITVGRSPQLMASLHRAELDMTLSTRSDDTLEGVVLRTSPTLWVCAANFILRQGQPVPLILGDEGSIFRRFALDALERSPLVWKQVYSSTSPIGIKAAVRAGLGVTPRSIELMGPDMRALGDSEGLPRLPDVRYYLWIRPNTVNPTVA